MKCFIVLSVCMFAVVTFLINREKLASKYNVVLVSKHDLKQYVNVTLRGVKSLCHKYRPDWCREKKTKEKPKSIDVVYLWVNGTINPPADNTGLNEASSPNRFREWKELYYSIELLKENSDNLGKIFVVTNGNRPNYPDMDGVMFIDHNDFIPLQYLPTFSSYTIQFNLDGIFDKVSDPFVLLDDDFFITSEIDWKNYVSSKIWYIESWGKSWKSSTSNQFAKAVVNSREALKKVYKTFKPFNCIAHTPVVVHHNIFKRMKSLIDVTKSMTKYRSKTSLQFQYMLAGVSKYSFGHEFKHDENIYSFVMMNDVGKLRKTFESMATSEQRKFLTLNDDIKTVNDHREVIDTFLRGLVLKSNALHRLDVDNYISTRKRTGGSIVFFNALRGKEWKVICTKLKKYDPFIVFLNEMDWGMARSNNEHTTRLLAQCLNMNYAFGVEFIELTKGNAKEEELTKGKANTWSWHGNAILSTNKILNPQMIRLPGTETFWKNGLNGKEQRNGGRMAISANIDHVRVVCTHLDYFVGQTYNKNSLRTLATMYPNKTTILAGDLGTHGRDPKTPNVLAEFGFSNAWQINLKDKGASGDWIMAKGVMLNRTKVISSGGISDHNIIVSHMLSKLTEERPAWCTKFPNRWNGDDVEVSFVDILKYFNTTMLTNGIDYSILRGTALGYKRHSDFIPWDDDVDLIIKKNDSSTARALVQKPFCTAKFWGGWKIFKCDSPRTSKYEWSYPFVDVFDNGNTDKHKKSAHDDILFPSVGVFMHGMALRGPKRLTKHLALLYGDDYMETCESPYWNHKTETGITNYKRFPCKDVLACFTE